MSQSLAFHKQGDPGSFSSSLVVPGFSMQAPQVIAFTLIVSTQQGTQGKGQNCVKCEMVFVNHVSHE